MSEPFVGAPVGRKEDIAMLRGKARYISDLTATGMLVATVVRSPFPHARILSIDTSSALAMDNVAAVYTADDLGPSQRSLASFGQFPPPLLSKWLPSIWPAPVTTMAGDRVRYVGEPVALVVATDRYIAEDAAELVVVDYEPLDPVTGAEQALRDDVPNVHDETDGRTTIQTEPWRSWCSAPEQWSDDGKLQVSWDRNTALDMTVHTGDVESAFAKAAHVVKQRYSSHRYAGVPLEGRGILAMPDPDGEGIMVWSSHQIPFFHRALIAESLGLPEDTIRVAQPYLGGGFGQKAGIYGEDVLIPFAAWTLGRPVKWLEDKYEHFQASSHSREQLYDAEMALDSDGRILGLRYDVLIDVGAYLTFPVVLPYLGMCHVFGPYRLPAMQARLRSIFTNKVPSAPYRGAGRPEVVFMMNRLVDHAARGLGLDPADIRRRNLIGPDEMPFDAGILYRDGAPLIIDSGNYPEALEKNLAGIDYATFRREQKQARAKGRYLGIGIACNIEAGGLGPVEGARVEIASSGDVVIHLGVVDSGQGHRTTFAQICADVLGMDIADISVRSGDTRGVIYSRGTYHSRAAVLAGNAVHGAAQKVRTKLLQLASHHLEVTPDDLELVGGEVRAKGTDRSMTLKRCARMCVPDGSSVAAAVASAGAIVGLPPGMEPGLDETHFQPGTSVVWGNASHAATVEVDPELGTFKILRYVVVHDCGRVLNPLIVEGQVHGGVAQGIGGTVLEQLVYDEHGHLTTSTLADYMLPRITDIPDIETISMESLSPLNPLGVKGAGEGGTIGPPSALAAAVEDALAPFGVTVTQTPLSPANILQSLRDAKGTG